MSYASTDTYTYTTADIEIVMRRVMADLVMIAGSSGAITESKAMDYAHDIELLAKNGFLDHVDITLLSDGEEVRALRYDVDVESGGLTSSRPGGVLWPRVRNAFLRIVLFYSEDYTATEKEKMRSKLRIGWTATSVDTSHASLSSSANRDYVSNAWGMRRKDFQ